MEREQSKVATGSNIPLSRSTSLQPDLQPDLQLDQLTRE